MTHTMTQAVQQLLVPPLLWFFFIGGVFSIAVGIGLVGFSSRMFSLFDIMNRWVSFRKASKPMAIQRESWPFVERHRRWFALVFIVASLFSIVNLVSRIDMPRLGILASAKLQVPLSYVEWMLSSMWWFLLLGSVLTIMVGIALGFFPAAMGKLEKQSGRWYSSRNLAKGADTMHTPLDKLVLKHPRILGAIIVIAALVNVVAVGNHLF